MDNVNEAYVTIHTKDCFYVMMLFNRIVYGVAENPKNDRRVFLQSLFGQLFAGYLFLFLQAMFIWHATDLREIPDVMYMFIEIIACNVKGAMIYCNRKRIWRMIEILEMDYFTYHQKKYETRLRRAVTIMTRLSYFYFNGVTICCTMFAIRAYLYHELPQSAWFPFDKTKSPYYEIVFVYLVVGPAFIGYGGCAFESLAGAMMLIICRQIDILHDALTNIYETAVQKCADNNSNIDDVIYHDLVALIQRHRLCIEYLQHVQATFSAGMFLQFIGSVIVISASLANFTSVDSYTDPHFYSGIPYLTMMTCQLLYSCWFGSLVQYTTHKMTEAIYLSQWHQCSVRIRKILQFMMLRMRRPVIITAWKFINVDLVTFISVIKLAYSIFTLYRRMES